MHVQLRADDGHQFDAYVAQPKERPTKAVIIIQEIFGINGHIRSVADRYAADGYLAIAPALFDRVERGVELKYQSDDMQRGRDLAGKVGMDNPVRDVAAAIDYAASQIGREHVGVIGFCWGGTLAWLAATRLNVAAAVGYYGGRIAQYAGEKPTCPVMLHFGALDKHIPPPEIDKVRQAHPDVPIYVYENAGHGFNCDQRADYEPKSAALARERTLELLKRHL